MRTTWVLWRRPRSDSIASMCVCLHCIHLLLLLLLVVERTVCNCRIYLYTYMAQRTTLTSECIHSFCIYFSFYKKKGSIVQPHTRRYFFILIYYSKCLVPHPQPTHARRHALTHQHREFIQRDVYVIRFRSMQNKKIKSNENDDHYQRQQKLNVNKIVDEDVQSARERQNTKNYYNLFMFSK